MNTKRLVMSFGMLAFVGAVVVGGTGAFFSDTETSEGNVFTAGSVTVGIEGIAHTYNGVDANNTPIFGENGVSFILEDLKPLDEGQVDYDLVNGENEAYICALVTETENNDNGINGPEGDAGDTTDGVGNGELGDFLNFKFGTETGSLSAIAGQWQTVGTAAANASAASGFEYCFGEFDGTGSCVLGANDDNLAQTDSLTADVQFYAVQTRNNADFTCGDLDEDPIATAVGAPLAGASFVYEVPASCDFTVPTDYATPALAAASASVPDGSTVCVDAGTYNEFEIDRPLTFVGLNDPSGASAAVISPSNFTTGGALIEIQSDNVTVQGLKVDGTGAPSTWFQYAGIRVVTSGATGDLSGINILENIVTGINNSNPSSGKTALGIQLFADTTGAEDILNVTIDGNHVSNIKSASGGAHGIQLVNDLVGIVVNENTVEDVDGGWETGIAVDGNNPANSSGVTITNNQLSSASFSVQVEVNTKSDEIVVNTNNIESLLYGGSSGLPSTPTLNAVGNWWGTATPTLGAEVIVNPVTNTVDFSSPAAVAFLNN